MPTRPSALFASSAKSGVAVTWLLLASVSALGACASSSGGTDPGSSGSSGQAATACEKDTRKDVFTVGLAKQSSAVSVKIVESTPSPPSSGS